jgi:hypothetical protein
MGTLWYAFGIYMAGVGIVLYLRPRLMFLENGIWKEFGLATDADQTIFPFWMFAIVWAILSYALASLLSMFFASVTMKSADTTMPVAPNASFIQPISANPNWSPAAQAHFASAPTPAPMPTRSPGYYILDPYANPATPRYIYYGPEPPGFTQAAVSS